MLDNISEYDSVKEPQVQLPDILGEGAVTVATQFVKCPAPGLFEINSNQSGDLLPQPVLGTASV